MIKIFKKKDIAYINVNNGILDVVFCSFGASVFRLKYNDEHDIITADRHISHKHAHGLLLHTIHSELLQKEQALRHSRRT